MTAAPATPTGVPPAIVLRDVCKEYRRGREVRQVVRDCSLTVEPGTITVMIGPSGAGKSTLVRLVAGFERPTRGEIFAAGRPVTSPGPDRQVMFQETALFPWMTTRDNVLYGPRARGHRSSEIAREADALMDRMGLAGFARMYPSALSGGMQRRAELARALANHPSVLILDEPFRGLDALTKGLMLEYYADLCAGTGKTTLFVTTDVDEAIYLADRILVTTAAPMRVRAAIEVDLPPPRPMSSAAGHDVRELKAELLAILYDEAAKSFASAGREAEGALQAYRRMAARPAAVSDRAPQTAPEEDPSAA